jgi:AGZA family xanthine/uracil permease-like MFS transporter
VKLGSLHDPQALLALGGMVLIAVLVSLRVKGALLFGIGAITLLAWGAGFAPPPQGVFSMPSLPRETLFAFDFSHLFEPAFLAVVFAFLFVDIFDTAGTLFAVGRLGGLLDSKGELPRADRAFASDAIGTVAGAAFGTSTVTSYIESAAGVEEGGRTGLTAVVVGVLFLLSLFIVPLLVAVPGVATAPALIVVGAMMAGGLKDIEWSKYEEAIPAFLTVAMMPFTYSIATGIVFGVVSYTAIRVLSGRWREIHPVLAVVTALLVAWYGWGR